MEKNISAQRERMADKLPEYEQNLAMIEMLLERKEKEAPFDTHYMLAEYAWTKVDGSYGIRRWPLEAISRLVTLAKRQKRASVSW